MPHHDNPRTYGRSALRHWLVAGTAVGVWMLVVDGQGVAWAGSQGVYQTTPDSGPGNTATPIGGGSSIAIGVNSISTSPTDSGDAIAIGVDAAAINQDSIAIGAQTLASGINTIAIGNNSNGGSLVGTSATGAGSVVLGVNSTSSGIGSSAFGNFTNATSDYGVALGSNSNADRAGLNGASEAFSGTAVSSPFGAVSVGQPGGERQIVNVAGGTADTDAVNVRQLRAVGNDLASSLGGGAGFDPTTNIYTAPVFTYAGQNFATVSGALASADALGVKYTPDSNGNATNAIDLTKGGALAPVSITGLAAATTSTGAVALSQMPMQYSTAAAPTTANPAVPSNDVTLIGTGGQPVTLHNLAAGAINSTSTDAVNGAQVFNQAASVAQALGGGAAVNSDGTVAAPTYNVQGNTYNNVGSALGGLDSAVSSVESTTKYLSVNSTGAAASATGTDATALGPNATASANGGVALGSGAVALRGGLNGATEDFSDTAVASTQGAVSVGDAGAERQITNVAGGTQDTDAVNVRQLKAVGTQMATALGGGATENADGTMTGPTYTVDNKTYSNVGGAVAALDKTGIKYDVDSAGNTKNSVTLAGGDPNQPVLIHNVGTGIVATDAANTGQVTAALTASKTYTDQQIAMIDTDMSNVDNRISGLQSQVNETRDEAHQAAAIGLAAASLRFDDRPGKFSAAIGAGYWKGQTATAIGVGYSLPDASTRLNATATTTGSDFGVAAGASFTLN